MNYDFSQLDDKEFENFANDLLEKVYETNIDRFKPWKDWWIDWIFYYEDTQIAIIQTKHYLKTWYKWLISHIKKSEVNKVKKLSEDWKLDKYIFVTSLELSLKNKEEIKALFNPYVKSTDDIFWKENLNSILSKNQDIERKYYRLWLSSTNVLQNIINSDIIWRSNFKLQQVREKSKYFVEIASFNEALKKLENNNVIIITWEPWIWKSTLSEQLCLKLVWLNNFNFYLIEDSVKEAEKVWNDEEKQLFYYDDFLWSNYFEQINDNKDCHISNFIDRVQADKKWNKKFILNSRTNILNYWLQNSTILSIWKEKIKKDEFFLKVNDLTKYEKAYILYKHMYRSDLTDEYIDEIYKDKNYFKIIKHKNFNPRLIEFITSKNRIDVDSKGYISYIMNKLDNPEDIWDDPFHNQADEYIRLLVKLVVFNWWTIEEKTLSKTYNLLKNSINNSPSHKSKDFNSIIKSVMRSFLNRNTNFITNEYTLFNPSISDFVLNKYLNNEQELINIYNWLKTYSSLTSLKSIYSNSQNFHIEKETYINILKSLINNEDIVNLQYISRLFQICTNLWIWQDIIIKRLQGFIDNPTINMCEHTFCEVLDLIEIYEDNLKITNSNFIYNYLEAPVEFSNSINIIKIWRFIDDLSERYNIEHNPDLSFHFKEYIEYYLFDKIDDIKDNIDLSELVEVEYSEHNWEKIINYDEEHIKDDILYWLNKEELSDFNQINFIASMWIDIDDIFSRANINIKAMVDDYLVEEPDYDKESFSDSSGFSVYSDVDIDNLFSRD